MDQGRNSFDCLVGNVAGAIFGDLAARFNEPPLMLIPPITFKVRKVLGRFAEVRRLTPAQKAAVADEIRVAIVPMLFSYELESEEIESMGPLIETAALTALSKERP